MFKAHENLTSRGVKGRGIATLEEDLNRILPQADRTSMKYLGTLDHPLEFVSGSNNLPEHRPDFKKQFRCISFLVTNVMVNVKRYGHISKGLFSHYQVHRARASFTIPLELLVTKDVVNDTLSAMGYPKLSMIYLNQ